MSNTAVNIDLARYASHYSESGFWRKIKVLVRVAGRDLVEKALCLYYAAQRPETPAWAKSVATGGLGYLILPADTLPDLIPFVGYADDLGVLALALTIIAAHVNVAVRRRARATVLHWFGP